MNVTVHRTFTVELSEDAAEALFTLLTQVGSVEAGSALTEIREEADISSEGWHHLELLRVLLGDQGLALGG
jgi:hypothetical protein